MGAIPLVTGDIRGLQRHARTRKGNPPHFGKSGGPAPGGLYSPTLTLRLGGARDGWGDVFENFYETFRFTLALSKRFVQEICLDIVLK